MKYDDIKDGKWAYNFWGSERWDVDECYDTHEEAMEAGKLAAIEHDRGGYEVGQLNVYAASIDVNQVIDNITDDAWDQCGEYAEDYLCHLPEKEVDRLGELLNEALNKWLDETNNHPGFYTLSSVSVHSIEQRSEDDAKSM